MFGLRRQGLAQQRFRQFQFAQFLEQHRQIAFDIDRLRIERGGGQVVVQRARAVALTQAGVGAVGQRLPILRIQAQALIKRLLRLAPAALRRQSVALFEGLVRRHLFRSFLKYLPRKPQNRFSHGSIRKGTEGKPFSHEIHENNSSLWFGPCFSVCFRGKNISRRGYRLLSHSPASKACKPASSRIATPSSSALASLLPASAPATT